MAPVNPEGQTARDLTDEEIANGEQWIAALTTGPVRYPEMKIDCSLLARLLAEVKRRRAVRPSEGQTAQAEIADLRRQLAEQQALNAELHKSGACKGYAALLAQMAGHHDGEEVAAAAARLREHAKGGA